MILRDATGSDQGCDDVEVVGEGVMGGVCLISLDKCLGEVVAFFLSQLPVGETGEPRLNGWGGERGGGRKRSEKGNKGSRERERRRKMGFAWGQMA